MNNWFKRNGIHFLIAVIFLVICFGYFTPAFQGKTLGQNDVTRAQSTQKEINDYKSRDTTILWTNQILGGMPAFQVWAPYPDSIATHIVNFFDSAFPSPLYIVFTLLFGSYFLFSVLKIGPWLSAAGALAFTFSSYNIIYIAAGHSNQDFAISLFAPILASIILVLQGKRLLGASLLSLFLAIEIKANHIQMTYYLTIALLILLVIELVTAIRKKTTKNFFKSLLYIAAAVFLAVLVNASLLWSTYEYSKYSIRGKSNLTKSVDEAQNGVPRSYAYEFSEGVGETLTFLIPNLYGGSSTGPSNEDSNIVKAVVDKGVDPSQAVGFAQNLPLYWGDKTFTEGPWYFGAAICFLFVLGLLIVRGKLKWWLVATVILTVLLSFGRNFPLVSDLFFDYFPLYNKFRAVESILSVTMLCFPILALLAINEIIKSPDKKWIFNKVKLAFYITGGIALIFAVAPNLFLSFKAANHNEFVNMLSTRITRGDTGFANAIANGLVEDRIAAARADAFRTLIFIALSFGIVWLFIKQKINVLVFSISFLAIILIDLWMVDRRYLKDEEFVEKQEVLQPAVPQYDYAAKDQDPDFRVIDFSQVQTQDATTPYFHKSIGGYSAARLKRYDELLETQFAKSVNHDVLDMLNTKYFIEKDTGGNVQMERNRNAAGHAWFVDSVKFKKNADEEMQALSSFSPMHEAFVDEQYKGMIPAKYGGDPNAFIKLTRYTPDDLTYKSGSTAAEVAVFSEIYYDKGWKMYIDGRESPYFRADYLLRAAAIPVGNHTIEFKFHPASYYTGEKISLAGSILLILALGGAIFAETRKKKDEPAVAAKK
jgi:hypothetical protein